MGPSSYSYGCACARECGNTPPPDPPSHQKRLTHFNKPLEPTVAPLGSRTAQVICSRLLQPAGCFRRRSLTLVVRHMKFMGYLAGFLLVLCTMPGCSTMASKTEPQELLAHHISVPRQYASSDSSRDRYVRCYDQAWYSYIEDASKNINDDRTADRRVGGRWPSDPSEAAGVRDGFAAAEARVHSLIGRLGKQQTEEVLKQAIEEVCKSIK